MAELVDLRHKISKFYKFTHHEILGMIVSIIVVAFVFSFKEWGTTEFDFGSGIFNFFNAILIVALSFIVHDSGQRLWGLAIGFRIEYRMWTYGIAGMLVLAFATRGNAWWIIVPGSFMLHHLAGHRLGFFRYGINYFAQAMIALAGPLFTLTLIIFLKVINSVAPNALLQKAIIFNIVYMINNMLPIPPFDGSKIYFGSRMVYAFVMPALIAATVLLVSPIPIFFSLLLAMTIGVVLWLTYYIGFERKVWKGPQ